jgi:chromosome segregation ATPase
LAPGVKMQPDDVYGQIMQLVQTSAETAAKVSAMHDALLGEHGHIGSLKEHIERLYAHDKELANKLETIRTELQTSATEPQSWIERGKGIAGLVIALGLLADLAAHLKGLWR